MGAIPVIHRCAEPGCRELTFTARCPKHSTTGDGELKDALADAVVELTVARERYEQAQQRVDFLEARAGIRRE
jgi:hypothetical protein